MSTLNSDSRRRSGVGRIACDLGAALVRPCGRAGYHRPRALTAPGIARTRPCGAIRRTVALLSVVSATAALLERLSCFLAARRLTTSSCLGISVRFAVAVYRKHRAL